MFPTPTTIDHFLDISEPGDGYVDDISFGLGDLVDGGSGYRLDNTTTPLANLDHTTGVVEWVAAAGATAVAMWSKPLPDNWAEATVGKQALQVVCRVRKKDSGADENATLKLQAQIYWANPGEAQQSLTTKASVTLPAASAGATTASISEVILDIGARLNAESKVIKRGALVSIVIGPDTTVGTVDMKLQLFGGRIRYRRHPSLGDTSKRAI